MTTTGTPSSSLDRGQQSSPNVVTVADRFLELCNQGKNFDVMRMLYAPDIVSVEADGKETAGQAAVIKKSEDYVKLNAVDSQTIRGPFFNGDGQFAVHFILEVTPKATGKRIALEEVAVYTVANGKISREQFFYRGTR